MWRREVVLVGDAAENPARSTAGKPQLRGLTTQAHRRGAHVPACNPSEMAAFLQTACPMLLYTVSAQCVGVAGTLIRETSLLLLLRGGPTRLCSNGFLDWQCSRDEAAAMQSQRRVRGRCRRWRSVAVPRDGWWRSSGDAHQRTPTSGREHTI